MRKLELICEEDTYKIIGVCMCVHTELGHGFREVVYKDAIEHELNLRSIVYEREKEYVIRYKGVILPHKFLADFVTMNHVILEVKAAEGGISDVSISQTLNYLKVSGCKVGLLVNFGRQRLEYKRLVF